MRIAQLVVVACRRSRRRRVSWRQCARRQGFGRRAGGRARAPAIRVAVSCAAATRRAGAAREGRPRLLAAARRRGRGGRDDGQALRRELAEECGLEAGWPSQARSRWPSRSLRPAGSRRHVVHVIYHGEVSRGPLALVPLPRRRRSAAIGGSSGPSSASSTSTRRSGGSWSAGSPATRSWRSATRWVSCSGAVSRRWRRCTYMTAMPAT